MAKSPDRPKETETSIDAADDEIEEEHANWILKAGLLAASSSSRFFNTVFGSSNERPSERSIDERAPSDPNDAPKTRLTPISATDFVLPSRKVADHLLDRFFTHAYIHWLDRTQFMSWYEGLWVGNDQVLDPVGEQINYANLNLIFALVYQTEPEEIADNQNQLAQVYFARSQKLLQLSPLDLNRPDMLWTLLLLTQWFQSVNNVQRCRRLVGLSIMIARNLALHDANKVDALPNQRQREMARRAWHGCILMDRITAMISGQPLQVSQEATRRAPLFEAIDDEYLSTTTINGMQPSQQLPVPSFFLAFCQLHLILGDVLEHNQNRRDDSRVVMDANHVIEIDIKLEAFAGSLPAHLHMGKADDDTGTYTGPIVHLYSRFLHIRILLYRVFFLDAVERLKTLGSSLPKSFADAVIHQGLLTCVRTAQQMLDLIGSRLLQGDRGPRLVPQWWHTVTYVYTAATVLIAAHIFPAVVQQVTAEALKGSLQQGFQILDHHSRYKDSAQRCKQALTVLYERHVNAAVVEPKHAPNRTTIPNEVSLDGYDPPRPAEDPDWDFGDLFDIFRGEGYETSLLNSDVFSQGMDNWL